MKKIIIIIVSIILALGIGIGSGLAIYNLVDHDKPIEEPKKDELNKKIYFQGKFFEDYIAGEYKYIETYAEYEEIFGNVFDDSKVVLNKKEFENYSYVIIKMYYDACVEDNVQVKKYSIDGGTVNVEVKYDKVCYQCIEMDNYDYYLLRVEKDFKFDKVEFKYDVKEDKRCEVYYTEDKPMIYIYPEKEMNVNVRLGNPEKLIVSYPKYNNSWNVLASPDGNLKYNGRNYYGLYWEGKNKSVQVKEDGFVIRGEDTSKFLEEKLEILGLNEREINEFIVYWLPKMESNKYNYIRFETREEIDNYMPLEVSPKPDTVIRVQMDFKGLDKPITVKEQELTKIKRTGYTVVEWGGTEIK